MKRLLLVLVGIVALVVAKSAPAHASCRETTDPSCDSSCGSCGLPVFWSNACFGIGLTAAPIGQFSATEVEQALTRAIERWMSISCGGAQRPSVDARFVARSSCDSTTSSGGVVVVFRDDAWPYAPRSPTGVPTTAMQLALTTLSLDPASGRIRGGALEVNSHDYAFFTGGAASDTEGGTPPNGYDLDFVFTHEIGHVLGLAHSKQAGAVMSPETRPGPRDPQLTDDDSAALCAIYLTDGSRSVDPRVAPAGRWAREPCAVGSLTCAGDPAGGCSAAPPSLGATEPAWPLVVAALLVVRGRRTRCAPGPRPRRL